MQESTVRTFSMIKPTAVQDGHTGPMLADIEKAGYRIVAMRKQRLSYAEAALFYAEHAGKGFYVDLCTYMSSGPIVAMVLEKEHAVADLRKLMGSTNPQDAAEGTLRKRYSTSLTANAVHGSDSPASAAREIGFFFSAVDLQRSI